MDNRVLIATPHAHGLCWPAYKRSCVNLENMLTRAGVTHEWIDYFNESLITRGRDMFAAQFLESGMGRLFFIDNDIEFSVADAALLLDMMNDEDIQIGAGCYRRKKAGEPYVVAVDGRLQSAADLEFRNGPFVCDYAGTGFMIIKREVFLRMQGAFPEWEYRGLNRDGHEVSVWSYFQDPLMEVGDGRVKISEDQFFCYRARDLGIATYAHPAIRLAHWGQSRFNSGGTGGLQHG